MYVWIYTRRKDSFFSVGYIYTDQIRTCSSIEKEVVYYLTPFFLRKGSPWRRGISFSWCLMEWIQAYIQPTIQIIEGSIYICVSLSLCGHLLDEMSVPIEPLFIPPSSRKEKSIYVQRDVSFSVLCTEESWLSCIFILYPVILPDHAYIVYVIRSIYIYLYMRI